MNADLMLKSALAEARCEILRHGPVEDAESAIADRAEDILYDWECEAAEDFKLRDVQADTPTVAHCDDWGTGEGRFHGRIG